MAIGDLRTRLRAKFSRRSSTASSLSSVEADGDAANLTAGHNPASTKACEGPTRTQTQTKRPASTLGGFAIDEGAEDAGLLEGGKSGQSTATTAPNNNKIEHLETPRSGIQGATTVSNLEQSPTDGESHRLLPGEKERHDNSSSDFPTPNTDIGIPAVPGDNHNHSEQPRDNLKPDNNIVQEKGDQTTTTTTPNPPRRPVELLPRRQSLLPHQQTRLIKTLLETELRPPAGAANLDYFAHNGPSTISPNMVSRKIWVKRPGASATLVTIHEDDLVDDVKDAILKKYANSMGRHFDAPDVTLRIFPREQIQERTLGPEEPMGRTLDAYFPTGQTVDEALMIDVPTKRTPKPSPQASRAYYEDGRPLEAASDYFPPMPVPVPAIPSPRLANSVPVDGQAAAAAAAAAHHANIATHSMSVLTTGHVPALPSPGNRRPHQHHRERDRGGERPRIGRQHTSSPTLISGHSQQPPGNNGKEAHTLLLPSRAHPSAAEQAILPSTPSPLPTPPAPAPPELTQIQRVATPPPRVSSPRPRNASRRKAKKANADHPTLPIGMLNGAIPPINVLIVEDNIINLKLLEAFMKRLKVRWQTAMNGKEAVSKWRSGGFHLVLMDIQLPIMSGLEATKEIRRLERLNGIGVFSSSASSSAPSEGESVDEPEGEDKLPSALHFKSPVIIVALTASSLQFDRHEALAAGCNDFLTKPVNFVWLERKVMEWGCMQALIDFDGWRKWKDFSQAQQNAELEASEEKKKALGAGGKWKGKKGDKIKPRSSLGDSGKAKEKEGE